MTRTRDPMHETDPTKRHPAEELRQLREAVDRLEQRVARLEGQRPVAVPGAETAAAEVEAAAAPAGRGMTLEHRIGTYYLAQAGAVALLAGIGFLITYLHRVWPPAAASLGGFGLAGGVLAVAAGARRVDPHLRTTTFTGSLLLVYYATLRLAFFGTATLIPDPRLGLVVLAVVLAGLAAAAVLRESQFLGGVVLFLGYGTALVGNVVHLTLTMIAFTACVAAYFRLRYHWAGVIVFALAGAYLSHLLWLLGNPLLGHPLRMIPEHHHNLVYLFVYAAVFAGANLFRPRALVHDTANIVLSFLNAAAFYLIAMLVVFKYWEESAALLHLVISAFFLATGLAYWLHRRSFYAASFYALTGFFALSVAILVQFTGAWRFTLLGWQSLPVIMLAIWFRSRILTVANLGIYLIIYLYYLGMEPPAAGVNLSYAAVGILSALLLDAWRRQVDFGTGFLRYAYLTTAFITIPFGLYHAVPPRLVSVSWLGASLFHFMLSFLLGDRAYRWMAILTFALTAIHVLFIDMARAEMIYRILSFVALGLVLLATSLVYARRGGGGGGGAERGEPDPGGE